RGAPGGQVHRCCARHIRNRGPVTRACLSAARHRVDDHETLVAIEQLLNEPDAGGANLHDVDGRPEVFLLQAPDDLDTEPVVATQDVAETRYESACHLSFTLRARLGAQP